MRRSTPRKGKGNWQLQHGSDAFVVSTRHGTGQLKCLLQRALVALRRLRAAWRGTTQGGGVCWVRASLKGAPSSIKRLRCCCQVVLVRGLAYESNQRSHETARLLLHERPATRVCDGHQRQPPKTPFYRHPDWPALKRCNSPGHCLGRTAGREEQPIITQTTRSENGCASGHIRDWAWGKQHRITQITHFTVDMNL